MSRAFIRLMRPNLLQPWAYLLNHHVHACTAVGRAVRARHTCGTWSSP